MKRLLISVVFLFLGVAHSAYAQALDVSIVQLLVNPDKYEGKPVRVMAYLSLELEENAIYLHREDFEKQLFSNGIGLVVTPQQYLTYKKLGRSYVIVEGVFSTAYRGHLETYVGSLHSVTSLMSWKRARK